MTHFLVTSELLAQIDKDDSGKEASAVDEGGARGLEGDLPEAGGRHHPLLSLPRRQEVRVPRGCQGPRHIRQGRAQRRRDGGRRTGDQEEKEEETSGMS